MFTGIVEDVGRIEEIDRMEGDRPAESPSAEARRFRIRTGIPDAAFREGESISVDGACLTVIWTDTPDGSRFDVEAIGTTLSRTVARGYDEGSPVNLERARVLGDRLDGHLVQGHVDGVGTVVEVRKEGSHHLLQVRLPAEVWKQTILHGSITFNGVSLTVNELEEPDLCQVAIIPHTWAHTNLSELRDGDEVNVEGDLVGKYVGRLLKESGVI